MTRRFDSAHLGAAVVCLAVTLPPAAPASPPPQTGLQAPPVLVADEEFRPLYAWVDEELRRELARAVEASPDRRRLLRERKLAVGVVDLTDAARPRFAHLNGNTMMYAASLPKIVILLAAYQSFEDGTLEETPEVRDDLAAMIRTSSNTAATAMIDRLGLERIAEVVGDPRYRLYDRQRGGGLWVGKRYAKAGERVGDPLQNLSHAATVTQVCRFYYLLATGRVVSPVRSRQMLADLADPAIHHKFVGVLERRAPRARLFRKSGSWRQWHSDSALVWGPDWRRYILVAMAESDDGENVLRQLVPVVEEVLRPAAAAGP